MTEVSITEARSGWSRLVREVEAGQALLITRRGRPAAVLVPAAHSHQGLPAQDNWVAFSRACRQGMQDEGIAFVSDAELLGVRQAISGSAFDLGQD